LGGGRLKCEIQEEVKRREKSRVLAGPSPLSNNVPTATDKGTKSPPSTTFLGRGEGGDIGFRKLENN